ncbi:hypothetical protein, partial [Carboxylicivirga sp. M1479]|uniref:hypothetical protein n=1 Tax=Carboxylicivirga sp. M1479 TaxID=2594476 RepID=UPI001C8F8B47
FGRFEASSCKTTSVAQPYNWFPPSQFTACSEYFAVHYFSAHDEAIGNLTKLNLQNPLSQIFYLFLPFYF